jgi:hypothetical protein
MGWNKAALPDFFERAPLIINEIFPFSKVKHQAMILVSLYGKDFKTIAGVWINIEVEPNYVDRKYEKSRSNFH